jgi:hypothetical protein
MEARLAEILATRGEAVDRPEAAVTPGSQEMRPVITRNASLTMATEAAQTSGTAPPADTAQPVGTAPPADTAQPVGTAPTDGTAQTSGTAPPADRPAPSRPPSPSPSTRPIMRKSLFDRLLGR